MGPSQNWGPPNNLAGIGITERGFGESVRHKSCVMRRRRGRCGVLGAVPAPPLPGPRLLRSPNVSSSMCESGSGPRLLGEPSLRTSGTLFSHMPPAWTHHEDALYGAGPQHMCPNDGHGACTQAAPQPRESRRSGLRKEPALRAAWAPHVRPDGVVQKSAVPPRNTWRCACVWGKALPRAACGCLCATSNFCNLPKSGRPPLPRRAAEAATNRHILQQ